MACHSMEMLASRRRATLHGNLRAMTFGAQSGTVAHRRARCPLQGPHAINRQASGLSLEGPAGLAGLDIIALQCGNAWRPRGLTLG